MHQHWGKVIKSKNFNEFLIGVNSFYIPIIFLNMKNKIEVKNWTKFEKIKTKDQNSFQNREFSKKSSSFPRRYGLNYNVALYEMITLAFGSKENFYMWHVASIIRVTIFALCRHHAHNRLPLSTWPTLHAEHIFITSFHT